MKQFSYLLASVFALNVVACSPEPEGRTVRKVPAVPAGLEHAVRCKTSLIAFNPKLQAADPPKNADQNFKDASAALYDYSLRVIGYGASFTGKIEKISAIEKENAKANPAENVRFSEACVAEYITNRAPS